LEEIKAPEDGLIIYGVRLMKPTALAPGTQEAFVIITEAVLLDRPFVELDARNDLKAGYTVTGVPQVGTVAGGECIRIVPVQHFGQPASTFTFDQWVVNTLENT
jgi:hypothetical protein